jgi:hypothetical protein
MRWLWAVSIVTVLAAAWSACGGSEQAAPSLSDADLKAIVTMTAEGLSWQIAFQNEAAVSNGEAAQTFIDPQKWLQNYEDWGRTGGHVATYRTPTAQGASLQAQVEAYSTVGGAKKALSAVRDFMTSGEALLTYTKLGYTNAQIDVVDAARIGDDSSAYRLKVSASGTEFDTLVIIFRRGSVLGQASVGAAPDTTDTADVEAAANQMDARIQNILNASPVASSGG